MAGDLDIKSHYQQYFRTVKATTPELIFLAYRLRYQVYFEEQKMIDEHDVRDHLETDVWDLHAIHGLQFHKPSNQAIGNVRLIPLETSATSTLPLEEHYTIPYDFRHAPINHLHQGRTGEISRLAILSSFRRRASDRDYALETDEQSSTPQEKRFPINYMPMCLAFTAIILMMEMQLDYGTAMMEPRLAKLLMRFGIELIQIGEPINYFGQRAPYLIFPEATYDNLPDNYRALFNQIKLELDSS